MPSTDPITERCSACDGRLCTCPPPPRCSTPRCSEPVSISGTRCYWCAEDLLEAQAVRPVPVCEYCFGSGLSTTDGRNTGWPHAGLGVDCKGCDGTGMAVVVADLGGLAVAS